MTNPTRDASLDFWILKTLEFGSANEDELARWIRHIDTLQFESQLLSNALEALAREELIESHRGLSNGSRYRLTAVGLQRLSTLRAPARSPSS